MNSRRIAERVALLVLLAATAAAMVGNDRETGHEAAARWAGVVTTPWAVAWRPLLPAMFRAQSDIMAGLVVATVGAGLAAPRVPFVPRGRRWPTRGMAAIAAGALGVAWNLAGVTLQAIATPTSPVQGWANPHLGSFVLGRCIWTPRNAVLGAWALLALAGRWHSAETGLGRVGRVLGWCWIGSIAWDLFEATIR